MVARIVLVALLASVGALSSIAAESSGSAAGAKRPNIVFILSDDHRWDCIGAAGNPHVKTPNIDQLAKEGVYFKYGTVVTPQCSPCRAALLTGLAPHQSGWYSNQTQSKQVHDRNGFASYPTVPGELQKIGYRTVLVGKWHLAPDPWNCGFTDVRTWLPAGAGKYRDLPVAHGNSRETSPTHEFTQDAFGKDAAAFLRSSEAKQKPFLLWLALTAPHTPLRPNPQHLEDLYSSSTNAELAPPGFTRGTRAEQLTSFTVWGNRRARATTETQQARAENRENRETDWHHYYAAISSVDEQVGRLREALKENGLAENTVIVFMGDNGLMRGSRGWEGKVLPYEESIRVPFIVYVPGAKAHGESKALISSLDLSPAFLRLAGAPVPEKWAGRDISTVLNGEADEKFNSVFCEYADNVSAKFGPVEYRLVRTPETKLIRWRDTSKGASGEELFDLAADPRELKNKAESAEMKDRGTQIMALLENWLKRVADRWQPARELVSGEGED
jgi:arylsulfatase A-like enzyme